MWGRGGANIQLNNNRKRRYKNNKKHYKNEYRNNTTTTATTTTTTTTTTTITIMTMNKQQQQQQQQKTQRNELTNKLGNKHQKWVRARENLAATGRVYARARANLVSTHPTCKPTRLTDRTDLPKNFRALFGSSFLLEFLARPGKSSVVGAERHERLSRPRCCTSDLLW